MNDHTRAEAVQWALNHAEAAEACDKEYRSTRDALRRQKALGDMYREQALASMWAQVAQAMPVD